MSDIIRHDDIMDEKEPIKTKNPMSGMLLPEKSSVSMYVGVGAFVVILIALLWYVRGGIVPNDAASQAGSPFQRNATSSKDVDAATATFSAQGTSDEIGAIGSDLNATDLDAIGDIDRI